MDWLGQTNALAHDGDLGVLPLRGKAVALDGPEVDPSRRIGSSLRSFALALAGGLGEDLSRNALQGMAIEDDTGSAKQATSLSAGRRRGGQSTGSLLFPAVSLVIAAADTRGSRALEITNRQHQAGEYGISPGH